MQSKSLSPDSRDFDIDDYIGIESCVDLMENHTSSDISGENCKRDNKMWGMERKDHNEYPPPIQLLVRTENLASQMPWVLKRHYTDDGRLILTEERLKYYEFFRAHRSNGRLMLQLVAFDDQGYDESNVEIGGEDGGDGEECAAAAEGRDAEMQSRLCSGCQCPQGALRTVRSLGKDVSNSNSNSL
ncbi:hypothetical protein SDJN02_06792, partial [Cucurbita argyrosperma subsp. argyrosperma]